jgi:hypothetical protein
MIDVNDYSLLNVLEVLIHNDKKSTNNTPREIYILNEIFK